MLVIFLCTSYIITQFNFHWLNASSKQLFAKGPSLLYALKSFKLPVTLKYIQNQLHMYVH